MPAAAHGMHDESETSGASPGGDLGSGAPGPPPAAVELVAAERPLLGGRAPLADFHLVGIPSDRGSPRSGAAAAPEALRRHAAAVAWAPQADGSYAGLRDEADGRVLLAGARLFDHGDLVLPPWEAAEQTWARIAAAADRFFGLGWGVPVFLGGDHAITEPLVRAWRAPPPLAPDTALAVLQLDAHSDLAPLTTGDSHHHGNVMRRVAALPHVARLVQVGVRSVAHPETAVPERVVQLGSRGAVAGGAAAVLAALPPELPCYVTIDLDVLGPAEAPGCGEPLPGGLPLPWVEELLERLGSERQVVGVDLVELVPALDPAAVATVSALRLLLRLLDAIHRRRRAAAAASR